MKTTGVDQARTNKPDSYAASWAVSVLMLLILPLLLLATDAGAAKISFEPNQLTVTTDPGEVVAVPVAVSLADTTASNSYANFNLSFVDGTLDPAWITNQPYVSLNSWYMEREVTLQISVPAEAKGGVYTSIFSTEGLMSNEQVVPNQLIINVEVGQTFACDQVPLFSDISYAEEKIDVREHRKVAIDLSGTVAVPEGCDILSAWYELTDEYGEMDCTEPMVINDDGTFSVAVKMVASRKGKDKDGRLYTVKFMAENEAGIGESPETTVVVEHDRGKRRNHDSKRWGHDRKKHSHDHKKSGHDHSQSSHDGKRKDS